MSLPLLIVVYLAAAGAIWIAGIYLSRTTDALDHRLGIGEALGGAIFLAVVTNLPEIAITVSAALRDDLGIAVGNILGGIAIQTVVLVVLDVVGLGGRAALTYLAASLQLVLEAALVVAVLVVSVMGTQLPEWGRTDPAAVVIVIVWIAGLWLLGRAHKGLPWQEQGAAPEAQEAPSGQGQRVGVSRCPARDGPWPCSSLRRW